MWLLVFVPAILQSSVFNFKSNHGPMISRSLRKSEAHLLIGMYLMVVMVFYLSSLIKKKDGTDVRAFCEKTKMLFDV